MLVDGRELSAEEARHVAEIVRSSDGPRVALDRARELAAQARGYLDRVPRGEAAQTLASLTEYVVSRKF
jgi:geranylgeranyl pyrophosphate synthase